MTQAPRLFSGGALSLSAAQGSPGSGSPGAYLDMEAEKLPGTIDAHNSEGYGGCSIED